MFPGCLERAGTGDCPQAQPYVTVRAMLVFDVFYLTERNVQKHADRESDIIILARDYYYGLFFSVYRRIFCYTRPDSPHLLL
jgi:hypothetical protein